MAIKPKETKQNESGSAMLITTILLLTLSVMVAAAMNIASRQYDLALLTRNTSNTYYLAKSAAEKQVDAMNKSIEREMTHILQELSKTYIDDLKNKKATILYQSDKIQVDNDTIKAALQDRLYTYVASNYVGSDKKMSYKASSDRMTDNAATTITIQTDTIYRSKSPAELDKEKFKVIVTATTMNEAGEIYDKQVVEGIIKIKLPADINNEIYEKYAWDSVTQELFQSAILSFSDIVVSGSGKLKVTSGDIRVGGPQDITGRNNNTYPEVDENGGVIAINGGKIEIADSLYCTNNVVVTNGWNSETRDQSTSIEVGGDIIAYTVGILDDYFSNSTNQSPFNPDHQITGTSIKVGKNIMVDNDVMIDRWVKNSRIEVSKSIFGVSDGVDLSQSADNSVTDVNPNQSSGVFSQGSNSQIAAQRMYVAGQPYITLQTGQKPLKLWESIGEPFNGIASFGGYATREELPINRDYLLEGSPFYEMIADDKIITDFTQTYAVAKVSGINTTAGTIFSGSIGTGPLKGQECKAIFTTSTNTDNQAEAMKFFYQGGSSHKFSEFMSGDDTPYTSKVQNIIQNIGEYYAATKEGYFRALSNPPATNYKGLRGYMTLMRSPLYKAFSSNVLTRRLFSDAVNMRSLSSNHTWSYETPIEVIDASQMIDISKFYVDEDGSGAKPYPSMIINTNSRATLTLAASVGKEFRGIIISAGPIKVLNDITVAGSMIIGDVGITEPKERMAIFQGEQAGLIVNAATLTVDHKPDELFNITAKDQILYRTILDALYLMDYSKQSLKNIMGEQGDYIKPALRYTDKSVLEVDTKGIQIVIESLKKVQ